MEELEGWYCRELFEITVTSAIINKDFEFFESELEKWFLSQEYLEKHFEDFKVKEFCDKIRERAELMGVTKEAK